MRTPSPSVSGKEEAADGGDTHLPPMTRKERNHKKRQRKKEARMAKRKREQQQEEEEARARALSRAASDGQVDGGEEGRMSSRMSSQMSSLMTYAGGATVSSADQPVRAATVATAAARTTAKSVTAVLAEPNVDDGREPESYDYGVVKGKPKGNLFVHGNYDRYYGYRLPGATNRDAVSGDKDGQDAQGDKRGTEGEDEDEDPRIGLLEKGWFHKKRCLDVGCNEGVMTLGLVKKFKTETMMAIDLDESLIKRACVNLRKARSAAAAEHAASQQAQQHPKRRKLAKQTMKSLSQTWFVHGNVLASKVEPNSFDCITALSVTKWIHLHSGDGGIRYFFSKVCDLLAPGGKFICEPQGWRSYKSAVAKVKRGGAGAVADTSYFGRLHELTLRPEDFADVLANEFGLRLSRELRVAGGSEGKKKKKRGFEDRTMYLFVKTR